MCETGKDAECEAKEVGGFKVVQAGTRRDLFHPITFFLSPSLSLSLSLILALFVTSLKKESLLRWKDKKVMM